MSNEKTTLEIIAPSVEEAVAKGLSQLGLPEQAVEVNVLDTGSRGLFGIGGRQARVRLSIKEVREKPPAPKRIKPAPPIVQELNASAPVGVEVEVDEDSTLRAARETVQELLDKMKVRAGVKAHYIEASRPNEEQQVQVDVEGDDLSILIGRRSETLNALQYIASLIVGKETEKWVPLMIDVQGFRSRRERQLRQLAQRMADQAISTGKRQVLEPMPANERRLIHLELSDHEKVITESVGEEPTRKVTISLKK